MSEEGTERRGSEAGMSGNDTLLARESPPEIEALAEIVLRAMPGIKMPPVTLAHRIDQMLRKRGFHVAPLCGSAALREGSE